MSEVIVVGGGGGITPTVTLTINDIIAGYQLLTNEEKISCFNQIYFEFCNDIQANKDFIKSQIFVNIRTNPDKYNLCF